MMMMMMMIIIIIIIIIITTIKVLQQSQSKIYAIFFLQNWCSHSSALLCRVIEEERSIFWRGGGCGSVSCCEKKNCLNTCQVPNVYRDTVVSISRTYLH